MFTPDEEKQIILQWLYDLYKRLGSMSLEEIYAYLLGQSKGNFINEAKALLDKLDSEKAEIETKASDFQKNSKELRKKWEKL